MPSLVAVCFDFDGTLADSFSAIAASVNHVRASRGLPPLEVAEVKRHVGKGPEYLLTHAVPGGNLAQDLARYRAHHPTIMREMTCLLPGAARGLAWLHQRGLRLALCSNKPRLFSRELCQHFGIEQYFAALLGPEDVPRPKPAPDMLLSALHRLQVAPAQALYLGDMIVDIEAARAAGMPVWVVPTGIENAATLATASPDRLLNSLEELPDHLVAHQI